MRCSCLLNKKQKMSSSHPHQTKMKAKNFSSMRGRGRGSGTGRGSASGRGRGRGSDPVPGDDNVAEEQQQLEAGAPVQPRQQREPGEPPAVLDDRGRARVHPDPSRTMLIDSGPVSRAMREIFRKCWFDNGTAWRFLTAEQREFYFQEFQKEFWWDSAAYSEEVIRQVFMVHAANRYKDNIHRMRRTQQKHISVTQDIWDAWNAFWNSEKEKKRSETARANRMSEPAGAGSGPVRHTGGSRSALKHMDVMERELGRKPSATELYTRLHSTKADKKPVDKRAQDMTDAITERLAAATQPQTGEGSSSTPAAVDETQVFLDIEGVNKKKRVYGLGSASSRYAGPSSSRVQRGSSSRTSQQADEEVERRVQAGIQEGLRLAREQQAANMAQMIREEIARMIPNLPAEYRPQRPPTPPDDDDTPAL
ncbi:uncharacterized protein LOC126686034 [Mercurialis annua]|uniref:uncharacterized protein LOC126686034 n=2 Tax=Mercurialis annua TaxID=3986 RepID=UPI0024ACAD1A|nr:uncharacterized protein LOC126686034 [Mercurialis annua]